MSKILIFSVMLFIVFLRTPQNNDRFSFASNSSKNDKDYYDTMEEGSNRSSHMGDFKLQVLNKHT